MDTPVSNKVNGTKSLIETEKGTRKIKHPDSGSGKMRPEVLLITTYPPRECGIATYSQDLVEALNSKFSHSFRMVVCPLESENEDYAYPEEIEFSLNTNHPVAFIGMAFTINEKEDIRLVVIQHEFGFFRKRENLFMKFLKTITKPIIIVFHTVLPEPDDSLRYKVQEIAAAAEAIIVMTNRSANILTEDYGLSPDKIMLIPHGTHLVGQANKEQLKLKYNLAGKKVLSTFGLLSSGKGIETTLNALPAIVKQHPEVVFLIIGKTHPTIVKQEGEKYRCFLKEKTEKLHLQNHVRFINVFLPLPLLLEYLQLTDVYLFTSNDPNQAVSGTFSYAISSGCPVVSTPIPHAREVLKDDTGVIIDFGNSNQLSAAVNLLLSDESLRQAISRNALHRMAPTAWENTAISHARLFQKTGFEHIPLQYDIPPVNLDHLLKMTTPFGIIQFSDINQPDIHSGYTLDDNARALVALCQHYELYRDPVSLRYIQLYFEFIQYCYQPDGKFLNYVNESTLFSEQNKETNLEDSNGRAIWALGYLLSFAGILPRDLVADAEVILQAALQNAYKIHSTRAMAFIIKGIYYADAHTKSETNKQLADELASRLLQMYRHESGNNWNWFESYLTYANSILPEAMLLAWSLSGNIAYKETALASFRFLQSKIFSKNSLKVISNNSWLHNNRKAEATTPGGEQPIDVAYTILALSNFYELLKNPVYLKDMKTCFDWFLGNNHLQQIMYNPKTGGCYDGLEKNYINLNQGAESTLSYLMARLVMEKMQHIAPFTKQERELAVAQAG